MSEEVKKAKAPAKPKKAVVAKTEAETPAAKKAVAKKASVKTESKAAISVAKPATHEEVAALARRFWAERGYQDGHHLDDWHRAEQELRGKAS